MNNTTAPLVVAAGDNAMDAEQRTAWLRSLTPFSIIYFVDPDDEGEPPSQHVLEQIKLAEGELISDTTQVELQPEYGNTFWTTAAHLRPAPVIHVAITVDCKLTLGFGESPSKVVDVLKGNVKSAISQGLLTEDTGGTTEEHSVDVKLVPDRSLTPELRSQLLTKLVRHWIEAVVCDKVVEDIASNGFVGYQNLTDEELLQEHRDVFAEPFPASEDGEDESSQ